MTTVLITLLTLGLVGLGVMLFVQMGRSRRFEQELTLKLTEQDKSAVLQQQLSDLSSTFTDSFLKQMDQVRTDMNQRYQESVGIMERTNKNWSAQFESSQKAVGEVKTSLVQLEEASKKIFDVGKDISGLNDILRAPKLRGNLGEFFLKDLLDQIMTPDQFEMQYKFKNGQIVDAIIKTADGLVPIDSKFPMESFRRMIECNDNGKQVQYRREFQRSVKDRINEINEKYIRPSEKTLTFALMYIPAENIYYETIIRDETLGDDNSLSDYASKKKVIPVSPNTLYAYLCTIMMGLKRLKIEKHAEEIIKRISRLHREFEKFSEHYGKMDDKIYQLRKHYEDSQKRLGNIDSQMGKIEMAGEKQGILPVEPVADLISDKN